MGNVQVGILVIQRAVICYS